MFVHSGARGFPLSCALQSGFAADPSEHATSRSRLDSHLPCAPGRPGPCRRNHRFRLGKHPAFRPGAEDPGTANHGFWRKGSRATRDPYRRPVRDQDAYRCHEQGRLPALFRPRRPGPRCARRRFLRVRAEPRPFRHLAGASQQAFKEHLRRAGNPGGRCPLPGFGSSDTSRLPNRFSRVVAIRVIHSGFSTKQDFLANWRHRIETVRNGVERFR